MLQIQENEIHHLLANLPLPMYVTTNMDSFMTEALKQRGRPARRVGPRWEQPAAVSAMGADSAAQPDNPVVFHLNGCDEEDQRQHLVLSDDDYLQHFVRLSRDQESIMPMNVLRMLSEHSFLFLGYDIDDWEFRAVLQGLIRPISQTNRSKKIHVGVQLDMANAADRRNAPASTSLDTWTNTASTSTGEPRHSSLPSSTGAGNRTSEPAAMTGPSESAPPASRTPTPTSAHAP